MSAPQKKVQPLSTYPTVKIFVPQNGRLSTRSDEWCFTYASQSVAGRENKKQPYIRTVCIRKVFAHEVRNILSFKKHDNAGSDGKVQYPLPPEGQPAHLPRFLGGSSSDAEEDPSSASNKHWKEGWYIWMGNNRLATYEKLHTMSLNLKEQQRLTTDLQKRREQWKQDETLRKQGRTPARLMPPPPPETLNNAIMFPLVPEGFSIYERFHKVFGPARRAIDITQKSIELGEHVKLAHKMWEKLWTAEPYELPKRAASRIYERWKERDISDDPKKGSKP